MSIDNAKDMAAKAACDFVENGQVIGLGTGSTAEYFIARLGKLCERGLDIKAVATSRRSFELARKKKIPLIEINSLTSIDLAVDGADEVDDRMRLIKGGGGALFREKIVASMATEFIIIADSSKMVDYLGKFPLPVEISPFAWKSTIFRLNRRQFFGRVRKDKTAEPFITENGNYIYDIDSLYPCKEAAEIEQKIMAVPGIIGTGFFIDMASKIIIGGEGAVKIIDRKR